MTDSIKYILEENKLPKTWYNINADLQSLQNSLLPTLYKASYLQT